MYMLSNLSTYRKIQLLRTHDLANGTAWHNCIYTLRLVFRGYKLPGLKAWEARSRAGTPIYSYGFHIPLFILVPRSSEFMVWCPDHVEFPNKKVASAQLRCASRRYLLVQTRSATDPWQDTMNRLIQSSSLLNIKCDQRD